MTSREDLYAAVDPWTHSLLPASKYARSGFRFIYHLEMDRFSGSTDFSCQDIGGTSYRLSAAKHVISSEDHPFSTLR